MNISKFQDEGDQFQELKQQVLTYTRSQQISNSPIISRQKNITKNHQKHKLEFLPSQSGKKAKDQFDFKNINKNIIKIQCNRGKIIPIGSVTFKSNFQCGNINDVRQIAQNTYEIELQKQTNSNRGSSWFYFSVEGIKGQGHFIIKGFTKASSLFNQGMKICYRDMKELLKWRRGGTRISYSQSFNEESEKATYQLKFSHFFKSNQYTCIQFAYCFPYGIKKLYNMLNHIKQQVKLQNLCKTFNGLNIPLITIGNANSKEVIILSARVHPGQTVSSFIMQGFINELVGDNQYGKLLKAKYLFKIVPMLNPDGVLKGNYRFSGYGCDLNRKWKQCKQSFQPEIYFMRQMIRKENIERKVIMYIDIHGHSRKKNVFFYGCCQKGQDFNPKPKEFPYLMEKIFDAYKYQNCCFNVQKDKDGTARIAMWKQLKIDHVYTLQSTFCGPEFGVNYLQNDFQKIGKKLCQGIAIYFYVPNENQKKIISSKLIQKISSFKDKVLEQLRQNKQLINVGDVDDSGSESQPQIGQIPQKQRYPETGLPTPESFISRQIKKQTPKIKISNLSNTFFSQSNPIQTIKSSKQKSQMSMITEEVNVIQPLLKQRQRQIQEIKRQLSFQIQSYPKYDKAQIHMANAINTYELQSLRASSLYQKNVRVHSLTRNNDRHSERQKMINPFIQQTRENKEQKAKINLMHGKEGVQYRRVKKFAQQNYKKQVQISYKSSFIRQLAGNQMVVSQMMLHPDKQQGSRRNINSHILVHIKNNKSTIAPRFFPLSVQKNRRNSIETSYKRNTRLQKVSINGEEFNIKGLGKNAFRP